MPRAARVPTRPLVVISTALLGLLAGPAVAAGDPGGVWPLSPQPTVVRGFEPPSSAYGAGHRGLDLLGRSAQPVDAALAGRVAFAGQLAGRGVVVVDHGTTRTTYEPVTPGVQVGDLVAAGGQVGVLTTVLSHCWPQACLHLGWIRNADDAYLDPMGLFGAGEVRLLPLGQSATAPTTAPTAPRLLTEAMWEATWEATWDATRMVALASGAGMGLLIGPA